MKVSKSLLQAIAVGITLSASSASCSLFKDEDGLHLQTCDDGCTLEHRDDGGTDNPDYNCPGCGMG